MARDQSVLDSDESSNDAFLDRRSLLKWTGTAVGAVLATSGAATAQSARSEPEAADPDAMSERVLDVSDGDDISSHVSNSSNGELLVLPEGTYEWNSRIALSRRNWGIRGDGDVTIMLPENWGTNGRQEFFMNVTGDNVLIDNLTFDSDGRPGVGMRCIVDNVASIRNVHIANDGPRTWDVAHTRAFAVGAESSGGHMELDGITIHNNGNIAQYNGGHSRVGIWCSRSGRLTVRNSVLAGFPNNAIYTRMPGEMLVENCVFANNSPSSIRLGGDNEVVRNCTFYGDHDLDGSTSSYPGRGSTNASAIMADRRERASDGGLVEDCSFVYRDVTNATGAVRMFDNRYLSVENCQFMLDQSDVPGIGIQRSTSVDVSDCIFDTENDSGASALGGSAGNYGSVENISVSPGLSSGPASADRDDLEFDWDDAYDYPNPSFDGSGDDGQSGDDDEDENELPNTIVFDGEGGQDVSEYHFVVDGDIDHSEYHSEYGTGGEFVDDQTIEGWVRGGVDGFRFEGELIELEVDGDAAVRVNGIEVDPAEFDDDDEGEEGNDDSPSTLAFDGEGGQEITEYRFGATGEIQRSEELSEYGTGGEFVEDQTIEGWVRGGKDGFHLEGELTELDVDGDATVYVDGEAVDPDAVVGDGDEDENEDDDEPLLNSVVFDGEGGQDVSEYRVAVGGEIERSEYHSEYGTGGEFVDDQTIEGWVRGGKDGFRFSGELTELEVDDNASVAVNGVTVDPSQLSL
ncbi:right-handed parallel beta-helix repeat-containing protein [Natrarchaeobius halalkaliphilus]|uniref:Right-handed parallel beta-helix repeat-containing protein n=1 Tax=Natrarchaeobius halalkaliphilus TaxID=1679091 RepID=A0A3N6M4L9_9EURY|nr:right-handed parallel beta-helix repeat-containing protein [Natrarchaeobius halalkaliphilus]RQG90181.1 right-handed parallel beta-helix repeat-containing protein [Natrarchaeobius halalkaliphilus]